MGMELWTGFLLGLVGSLHCAGMCGPLMLALPATGNSRTSFLWGRVAYQFGRVLTYGLLGAGFGLLGETLALAGFQRWVSLGAGIAIISSLLVSSRFTLQMPIARAVAGLKSGVGRLLRRRTFASAFWLGVLNGLLPCGLVYAAGAGAIAAGGFFLGVEYMCAFGLGTVPMMLGLGLAGPGLQRIVRFRLQPLLPAGLAVVGALLILRGLSLGIPYLSPDLSGTTTASHRCH